MTKNLPTAKGFAKEKNLKISGGSDFHRDEKQRLGYGVEGTVPITEEYLLKNVMNKTKMW